MYKCIDPGSAVRSLRLLLLPHKRTAGAKEMCNRGGRHLDQMGRHCVRLQPASVCECFVTLKLMACEGKRAAGRQRQACILCAFSLA